MKRELERRLAEAEKAAWAAGWTDRQQAHHRLELRLSVKITEYIRERFLQMGLDPALAISLQRGDESAAELAAIPDSEALEMADNEITRADAGDRTGESSQFRSKMKQVAARFHDGSQPDFASASPAELFAYCIAVEELAWGESPALDWLAPARV
jgi:hypothetical protein